MRSPAQAPSYSLIREVKTPDSGSFTTRGAGINCTECRDVNIQLSVKSGDSVTAKFYSWSEADEKFIPILDDNTYGPYTASQEISFPAQGRIIFVALTGTVTGTKIYASHGPY